MTDRHPINRLAVVIGAAAVFTAGCSQHNPSARDQLVLPPVSPPPGLVTDAPATDGLPVVAVAQAPGIDLALHLSRNRCGVSAAGPGRTALGASAPRNDQEHGDSSDELPEQVRNALGTANKAVTPWGAGQLELFCGKYNMAVLLPPVDAPVHVRGSGSSSRVDAAGAPSRTLVVAGPPGELYVPPLYPGNAPPAR
ncbi:hypothetical protein ORV05_20665 [Amycolatopsis cynarae]|uniref:Lipoprotein n=1 Tax=Amycolatopsis cynarae TaxID=2995223 RepID=A0ABY7AU38_9PSEU|nr:hypothetical protein [Amycolatopsis sp. HUAS 11-8]WAL63426.1 hypothetical protein ORV05_20665 [Amycolatopsis sp. HUAS 11-8]